MPDAAGNFKGISVPELPWRQVAPVRCAVNGCGNTVALPLHRSCHDCRRMMGQGPPKGPKGV